MEVIKYFSLRMVVYFGLYAQVTDAERDESGTEYYRLNVDHGENAWDGRLLRVDQRGDNK